MMIDYSASRLYDDTSYLLVEERVMKTARLMFVLLMTVCLLLVPAMGCNGAEPTETPPPVTPTTPPTITPEFSTVEASLFGQTVSFDLGPTGQVWDGVDATSADGNLSLAVGFAAFAWDEKQEPITSFSAALVADPPAGADETVHLIAEAYSFGPGGTSFSPPAELTYTYDIAKVEALGLTEEDISLATYDADTDTWKALRGELDTAAKTLMIKAGMFRDGYTLAVIASEPSDTGDEIMTELDVRLIYITDLIATNAEIEVVLQTMPGATVLLQPVNPKTGTLSAWPKAADGGKLKVANEKGEVTYSWELYYRTAVGDGVFEVLATTNTDPAFLAEIKESLSARDKKTLAERDDTVFVEIPYYVDMSEY
jgi:hypothetical protein